ncbi:MULTISPECIES: hypothetical protein [unclassified Streptomyces]|uniref:hypothetical protein n=1 Tax=unclassified Streptomyces TaxID=2593676 RepID=UPI00168BB983|nr:MULTISPECIES: hypothetical protein [unclassified Streptomyces]MBD3007903.1 hypothetical protein [Streptomyces sp. 5-10]
MKDFAIPLVIAVIGLAATGLGALVGARATRFGAERNAETVRRQVQDQAAVEHGHWLRQQRLNTYESFLEAWDECLRITQASAAVHDPDSTGLEDLREAAGRMAERARRIALLGPEEVTRTAEELTETMQEDVAVSTRFIEVAQAATAAVDSRAVPADAMADATEEYRQRTEQLGELMRSYRDQGRSLRDLDGHPLLGEVMRSIEQYRHASREARGALEENLARLSGTMEEASAMVAVLTRNKQARELSRERFTSAVRQTLGTPPMTQY